jgi:hypothetical protein
MEQPRDETWWEGLLAPRALFLGIALAFATCTVAGHVASRHNYILHFDRFHLALTAETLYHPTARQIRSFGRDYLDPGKIIVVIGGSSVLHGTGQRVEHLWSRRLQELLGDEYQVVNLAMRSGLTAEFGEIAAEIFERDGHRVLFVSDLRPGDVHPDPNGNNYQYFFWDAWYKGLVLPDPARDARLTEEIQELEQLERSKPRPNFEAAHRVPATQQRQLQTQMVLDRALFFNDLWNTLAYTCFHTVWTAPTRQAFARPRRSWPDLEPEPLPLAKRYARDNDKLRDMIRDSLPGCVKDAAGNWAEDPTTDAWRELERRAAFSFPSATRKRTLLLAIAFSSHYLRQLSPEQQRLHANVAQSTVRHLQAVGLEALALGQDYPPEDYADWIHLTEGGGTKLATRVAPIIQGMAQRLGMTAAARGKNPKVAALPGLARP